MYLIENAEPAGGKQALAAELAGLLGGTVSFRFLAQGAHWNVKGAEFSQFHDFFVRFYSDAEDAIDTLAEYIVILGYQAPFAPSQLEALACFQLDGTPENDPLILTKSLYDANEAIIAHIDAIYELAEQAGEHNISNFMADRRDKHTKWRWQLGTTIGIN